MRFFRVPYGLGKKHEISREQQLDAAVLRPVDDEMPPSAVASSDPQERLADGTVELGSASGSPATALAVTASTTLASPTATAATPTTTTTVGSVMTGSAAPAQDTPTGTPASPTAAATGVAPTTPMTGDDAPPSQELSRTTPHNVAMVTADAVVPRGDGMGGRGADTPGNVSTARPMQAHPMEGTDDDEPETQLFTCDDDAEAAARAAKTPPPPAMPTISETASSPPSPRRGRLDNPGANTDAGVAGEEAETQVFRPPRPPRGTAALSRTVSSTSTASFSEEVEMPTMTDVDEATQVTGTAAAMPPPRLVSKRPIPRDALAAEALDTTPSGVNTSGAAAHAHAQSGSADMATAELSPAEEEDDEAGMMGGVASASYDEATQAYEPDSPDDPEPETLVAPSGGTGVGGVVQLGDTGEVGGALEPDDGECSFSSGANTPVASTGDATDEVPGAGISPGVDVEPILVSGGAPAATLDTRGTRGADDVGDAPVTPTSAAASKHTRPKRKRTAATDDTNPDGRRAATDTPDAKHDVDVDATDGHASAVVAPTVPESKRRRKGRSSVGAAPQGAGRSDPQSEPNDMISPNFGSRRSSRTRPRSGSASGSASTATITTDTPDTDGPPTHAPTADVGLGASGSGRELGQDVSKNEASDGDPEAADASATVETPPTTRRGGRTRQVPVSKHKTGRSPRKLASTSLSHTEAVVGAARTPNRGGRRTRHGTTTGNDATDNGSTTQAPLMGATSPTSEHPDHAVADSTTQEVDTPVVKNADMDQIADTDTDTKRPSRASARKPRGATATATKPTRTATRQTSAAAPHADAQGSADGTAKVASTTASDTTASDTTAAETTPTPSKITGTSTPVAKTRAKRNTTPKAIPAAASRANRRSRSSVASVSQRGRSRCEDLGCCPT